MPTPSATSLWTNPSPPSHNNVSVEPSVDLVALDRIGGAACLDLINTIDPRYGANRRDYLPDYHSLLAWSILAGSLTSRDADRLAGIAGKRPDRARHVHQRAIRLRESLFELLRRMPISRKAALATLNLELAKARRREITESCGAYRAEWPETQSLDSVLWPIVESATDLITSSDLARVKECDGERCGWLFLDTSKAGRRRWCSMSDCGNRAKNVRRRSGRLASRA